MMNRFDTGAPTDWQGAAFTTHVDEVQGRLNCQRALDEAVAARSKDAQPKPPSKSVLSLVEGWLGALGLLKAKTVPGPDAAPHP